MASGRCTQCDNFSSMGSWRVGENSRLRCLATALTSGYSREKADVVTDQGKQTGTPSVKADGADRIASGRTALLVVMILAGLVLTLAPGPLGFSPSVSAGIPTPIDPNELLPGQSPSPSPSPSPTQSSEPEERDREKRKNGGSSNKDAKAEKKGHRQTDKSRQADRSRKKGKSGRKSRGTKLSAFVYPTTSYSSSQLVASAAELRALGAPQKIYRRAYQPFVMEGQASWADTWGAPRFGPGQRVRKHKGQDIFCNEGESVLAPESGRVEFDTAPLGGRVARLHLADGTYLYFAHLSGWNGRSFSSGDPLRRGQVLGFCGNSGNAEGTPPHVHLGWYHRDGTAPIDPHAALLGWLQAAEARSSKLLGRWRAKKVYQAAGFRTKRLFGSTLLPQLTLLTEEDAASAAHIMTWNALWPFGPLWT